MKKSLFIAILLFSSYLLSAGDYQIGTDTTNQNYVPLYGYVNYNWSKFFYSAAEMQTAGFTTTGNITKIAFQLSNTLSGYVTDNQKVYMRAWYDYEYFSSTSNYPGTTSFFQVYSGSISWDGPGWVEITLDTPYTYNPIYGLEILWENRDGTRISGPPKFCYTATENYSAVQHTGSSSSFPTTNGTRRRDRRPNIWFITPATEAPSPAVATIPGHEATGVNVNTPLRWNHTGGSPTGYRLWLGTNNPPSNIVAALPTSENNYQPEDFLAYGTTYYWRIVPFNEFGSALDCPVWSFSTLPDPSITEYPYLETFDGSFPPSGWTHHSGGLSDPITLGAEGSSQWQGDDWLNIASVDKAAKINIWGNLSGYLISPIFNLPSNEYVLEFDAAILRYNQPPDGTLPNYSATDDQLAILIGDGFSWSLANVERYYNNNGSLYCLNEIPTYGHRIRIPLTAFSGHIRIAIFAGSLVSNDDNDYMINNFQIVNQTAALSSPNPICSINSVNGQPILEWDTVPNAVLYRIYKANNPYGDFNLFDTTISNSYPLNPTDQKSFFKITAE